MATKLNKRAFEYAQERITEGRVVLDDRDAWSEHQPTTPQDIENAAAHLHGMMQK
jgi:hypothetical protein